MNVVFTFLVRWAPHIGTELELVQKHLDAGDDVTILTCLDDVPSCVSNPTHSHNICSSCMQRRLGSLRLLSRRVRVEGFRDYLTDADFADEAQVQSSFESVEKAQNFETDGWDVGFAALSTTVHRYRDPDITSDEARDVWRRLLTTGFRSYRAAINYIDRHPNVDRFYIFNGRFAIARGILRACQQRSVDVFLHERGSDNTKYALFENHLPHDRAPFVERLERAWENADPDNRETIGTEFFERRRRGIEDLWHSFIKQQETGQLPDSWDATRKNLVIFNSSEDEFIGIGKEWQNPIYPSQGHAIEQIVGDLKDDSLKIYVRMHPNLTGIDNSDTRRILALDGKGVEIISAESSISTYDLIDQADKTLSFGSTVGIEATYWGTPSVSAGLSFYRDLDATHNADDHRHTIELLRSPLRPKDRINAIRYGYYLRTFGLPLTLYEASSFSKGKFAGRNLFCRSTPATALLPGMTRLLGKHPKTFVWCNTIVRAFLHYPFVAARLIVKPAVGLFKTPKRATQ